MGGDAVAGNLLGCPTCSAFVPSIDDLLTLKEHQAGGSKWGPECPASRTEGVDLGPIHQYVYERGELIFVGGKSGPRIPMLCPRCHRNVSIIAPPNQAFNRRLRVHVRCPDDWCRAMIPLTDMREGPQGGLVSRGHRTDAR
jgi:hypothetical protein